MKELLSLGSKKTFSAIKSVVSMGDKKRKSIHQSQSQKHFDINSLYKQFNDELESPELGHTPHSHFHDCNDFNQFPNSPDYNYENK